MTYCSKCGLKIDIGEQFCSDCGNPIESTAIHDSVSSGAPRNPGKAVNAPLLVLILLVVGLVTFFSLRSIISKSDTMQHASDDTRESISAEQIPDEPLTPSLPEVRLITFGGRDSSVQVYDNDELLWDSQQGEFIACAVENLYYKVGSQLRYVKIGEYEPKLVDREFFNDRTTASINTLSRQLFNSDYILLNNYDYKYDDQFRVIFNAVTGGDAPDIIKFKISSDNDIRACTYYNGWLYFEIKSPDSIYHDTNLYRFNIDTYNLGSNSQEHVVKKDDVDLINSFFNNRDYEIVGDYIYFPRENMLGEYASLPDRLCAKKNLVTGEKELIYEFVETDGFKDFVGLIKMLKIGEFIVYFGEYKEGDIDSYKACFYNTQTNTYEIKDTTYLVEYFGSPYKSRYHAEMLYSDGTYAMGYYYGNTSHNEVRFYKIETDGSSIAIKDIEFFKNSQDTRKPMIFQTNGELFIYNDQRLYYLDQVNDELIAYDNTYENLCYVQIITE